MTTHLFVSHANPEDNEFALWLSLQLTAQGYHVWCDLTGLLGGEDFWQDIEAAIRSRTAKFLFVTSRGSNSKTGPLQELQVAHNVKRASGIRDFVIPLLLDDLPHGEMNIQLARLNAIPFNESWARGLRQLLDKLEKDQVPRDPSSGPTLVSEWWSRDHLPPTLLSSPEDYLTNWYRVVTLPDTVRVHTIRRNGIGQLAVPSSLPYAAIQQGQYLITFASDSDLTSRLSPLVLIVDSADVNTESMLTGTSIPLLQRQRDARNLLVRLLDATWLSHVKARKLPTYELSDGAPFLYFPLGFTEGDKVRFNGVDNRPAHRSLVGYKTRKSAPGVQATKSYWHFGLRAKPLLSPFIGYAIRPHVIFSDDGRTPWVSKASIHTARRSWCKDWWNADWRDRILASVEWLSGGHEFIEITVASDRTLQVAKSPLTVTSPVSYLDPEPVSLGVPETLDEDTEEDPYNPEGQLDEDE